MRRKQRKTGKESKGKRKDTGRQSETVRQSEGKGPGEDRQVPIPWAHAVLTVRSRKQARRQET